MSGFEIVGVVLGAIPLVISAIEKYKATSRSLKLYRLKVTLMDDLIRSLKEQKLFIECDLSLTLRKTSIDPEDIETMLQDPTSGVLGDPDILAEVEACLGKCFDAYIAALIRCEDQLMQIAQCLTGLASDGQVCQNKNPTSTPDCYTHMRSNIKSYIC